LIITTIELWTCATATLRIIIILAVLLILVEVLLIMTEVFLRSGSVVLLTKLNST